MKKLGALVAAVAVGGATLLAGTAAADNGLSRFHHQELDWKACDHKALDEAGAQCADVEVPLNYAEPRGRTISVAISRIKATDPGKRRGVMLSNPGGPGGPGLDMTLGIREAMTPEVRAQYDLIGMDPRGIGRSNPVDCGWPVGLMLRSPGVDRAAFDRTVRLEADLARQCADTEGDLLRHISTRNTARDMDVIRGALGESKINYFGWSYGTYLGSVYTQMFPRQSDRFVLDSAVDSKRYGTRMFQDMGAPNEAALDEWAEWTAERDSEYHLGTTGKQVRALVEDLVQRSAKQPIRIGEYEVDQHALPIVLFMSLADPRANPALATDVRQLVDAADGKQVEPNPALKNTLEVMYRPTPETQLSGQAAVLCGDKVEHRDPEYYWRNIERTRAEQPLFGAFANGISACAFWGPPAEKATVVRNSVPALIVQTTGDTRTSYESGVDLHRSMKGSKLVTLQDVRVHAVFGNFPNSCAENAVNTYFADGTLPATDLTCRAD
ncbi:alpha/beta fold hydrolase [Amycolatopsis sp. YIM 10]|uniref:alpha/beta fold hydrolase n=1 Tax=Amycolatopsis sp. YIM 10 TaxID=2653857 RepID=UPI0012903BAC|nr:alpha/beta fold hydrolase [Amycolatopsis sp. YIM 10]QFU94723.1 Tripeptidyl aminopeptidase precursor [Amycolatopsis sp. YIM 10]